MQDWDIYQRAALEYSKMRPRTVAAMLTPVADTKVQTPPADCLHISYLNYGAEITLVEALTDETGTQGWSHAAGQLYITPAPTVDETLGTTTPVQMVYLARHLANEDTQTFPTIPVEHLHHVDDLEQAILLELEADDVAKGPSSYSIGQTQVSREAAITYLRQRAAELRGRVRAAVEEPFALWS